MKLIIHGGFFSESDQSDSTKSAKQNALTRIIQSSFEYLKSHSALETSVYAVSLLEDDELFNAGTGSQIQSDGKIRMSAALMDGKEQILTGVINLQDVKNPIQVAKKIREKEIEDRVLSDHGAEIFARENGFEVFSTRTVEREKEYQNKLASTGKGTVGCVALDQEGLLAVATSTGGKGFEIPGRVSDSATVAGNYANSHCAVSCTGVGEDIVSNSTAVKIVTRVTDGMPIEKAFDRTFQELKQINGFAGAIGIDKQGNIYHQDSHPKMVFASYDGKEIELFQ